MIISLHFTDEEIIRALKAHGFTVTRSFQQTEDHVHGSRFITRNQYDRFAHKGGHTEQYKKAFEKLIKQKLLS